MEINTDKVIDNLSKDTKLLLIRQQVIAQKSYYYSGNGSAIKRIKQFNDEIIIRLIIVMVNL